MMIVWISAPWDFNKTGRTSEWHLTGEPIHAPFFTSGETLTSPSPPCWSAGFVAVLFEGGELSAEVLLHMRPDLVGFRTGEGLQHSFTPAGERVKTLSVYSVCREIKKLWKNWILSFVLVPKSLSNSNFTEKYMSGSVDEQLPFFIPLLFLEQLSTMLLV